MIGVKLSKNSQIEKQLEAHADYIFKEPGGSFFPRSSPLYRFIEEGATPKSKRDQMRKESFTREFYDEYGVKQIQEVPYWREVWAANVRQARVSRSRPLITSLGTRHVPIHIQAMNQVAFDSPPEIYVIWFYKYFMTVFEGKELTDKNRYTLLNYHKDHFRDRVAMVHLWVAHNLPKQMNKLRAESAQLRATAKVNKSCFSNTGASCKEIKKSVDELVDAIGKECLPQPVRKPDHRGGTIYLTGKKDTGTV